MARGFLALLVVLCLQGCTTTEQGPQGRNLTKSAKIIRPSSGSSSYKVIDASTLTTKRVEVETLETKKVDSKVVGAKMALEDGKLETQVSNSEAAEIEVDLIETEESYSEKKLIPASEVTSPDEEGE